MEKNKTHSHLSLLDLEIRKGSSVNRKGSLLVGGLIKGFKLLVEKTNNLNI